jgi:hypothetical protein
MILEYSVIHYSSILITFKSFYSYFMKALFANILKSFFANTIRALEANLQLDLVKTVCFIL